MDDPMYVRVAQHIVESPLDFYGFDMNWFGRDQPVYETNFNPPGLPYTLAAVSTVTGWTERPLHFVTSLFAGLLGAGAWILGTRFTKSPLIVALATIGSPVALVSANSVMTDIPMYAFYVWSVALWVKGTDTRRHRYYFFAAVCIALSSMYKYFGVTAIPLLFCFSLCKERRIGIWACHFLFPVAVVLAYQVWFANLYGSNPFGAAASFATNFAKNPAFDFMKPRILIGLSFAGGTLLMTAFLAPVLWRIQVLGIWALALIGSTIVIHAYSDVLLYRATPSPGLSWLLSFQYALYCIVATQIVALAVMDLARTKSPESALISAWILGVFVFAVYLNWSITARTLLPLTLPAALLIARRMEIRLASTQSVIGRFPYVLIALALGVSVWVMLGDYVYANAFRVAAADYARDDAQYPARYWFEGHYGFQFYMQENGEEYFTDDREADIKLNDRIVLPTWSSVQARYDRRRARSFPQLAHAYRNSSFVSTQHPLRAAGFYTSLSGPLPYGFAPAPSIEFEVYHIGIYESR